MRSVGSLTYTLIDPFVVRTIAAFATTLPSNEFNVDTPGDKKRSPRTGRLAGRVAQPSGSASRPGPTRGPTTNRKGICREDLAHAACIGHAAGRDRDKTPALRARRGKIAVDVNDQVGSIAGKHPDRTVRPGGHNGRVRQHPPVKRIQRGNRWLRLIIWPYAQIGQRSRGHNRHVQRISQRDKAKYCRNSQRSESRALRRRPCWAVRMPRCSRSRACPPRGTA